MEFSNRQIKDIKTVCNKCVSEKDKELQNQIIHLELKIFHMQLLIDKLVSRNEKITGAFWILGSYPDP